MLIVQNLIGSQPNLSILYTVFTLSHVRWQLKTGYSEAFRLTEIYPRGLKKYVLVWPN